MCQRLLFDRALGAADVPTANDDAVDLSCEIDTGRGRSIDIRKKSAIAKESWLIMRLGREQILCVVYATSCLVLPTELAF